MLCVVCCVLCVPCGVTIWYSKTVKDSRLILFAFGRYSFYLNIKEKKELNLSQILTPEAFLSSEHCTEHCTGTMAFVMSSGVY